MIQTPRFGTLAGGAVGLALLALGSSQAQAQQGTWLAYQGCWESAETAATEAVCISPSGGMSADLITVQDGQVTSRRTLTPDGAQRPLDEQGCTGWERARWSQDGQRIYLRSELTCEGGARRVTSGAISMTSPGEWIDIQTVEAGGYPIVRVTRYREAGPEVARIAGVPSAEGRELAIETTRTAAAEPLAVEDVEEASRELEPQALDILLFERGGVFEVNAEVLTRMADAGVPDRVIDLVVALAYPDVFNVNSEARLVGYHPAEAEEVAYDQERRRYGPHARIGWDPFYYDPWGYGYYGYGRYGYSPFGWGNPYGWRSTGGPVIVITQPDRDVQFTNPRMVKGRGYTRGASGASAASSIRPSRTSGSTGAASVSRGSTSGGASKATTGRTAKRRGGG